jgi:hypothetical protein
MTPTRGNGYGGVKMVVMVLSCSAGIAGGAYGLMSNKLHDRREVIDAQMTAMRADIDQGCARLDREEAATVDIRERLARIETKVDALLARVR